MRRLAVGLVLSCLPTFGFAEPSLDPTTAKAAIHPIPDDQEVTCFLPPVRYPVDAQRNNIQGNGSARIRADRDATTFVAIERSTGDESLDAAMIEAAKNVKCVTSEKHPKIVQIWPIKFRIESPLRPLDPVGRGYMAKTVERIKKAVRSNLAFDPDTVPLGTQAVVRVDLDVDGKVTNRTIVTSSGYPDFDSAVLRAVDRTDTFPIFPGPAMKALNITFNPHDESWRGAIGSTQSEVVSPR
ncbi:TonB family protein [Ralstonia pickettii]|uniref:TonB family protein n=1 Tax=Ralstonia pickettii TaxID=329 RepID=UPI0009C01434|nr:TonB family protein [Ralstonia pickettii]